MRQPRIIVHKWFTTTLIAYRIIFTVHNVSGLLFSRNTTLSKLDFKRSPNIIKNKTSAPFYSFNELDSVRSIIMAFIIIY